MSEECSKKNGAKLKRIIEILVNENIFEDKKGDGIAYNVLYIIIPVIVTVVSLKATFEDDKSIIYCYMTIMISASNGIYDAVNRWHAEEKSIRNTKLFGIGISNGIVSVYCLSVIMGILIAKQICRCDKILYVYGWTIIVSMCDAVSCFADNLLLIDCIEKGDN